MNENTCITHKNTGGGGGGSWVELFRKKTKNFIIEQKYFF